MAAIVAAGAILAVPAGAAAHPPPSVVAWHVLKLANKTLAATGTPSAQLVQVVVCARRVYPRYSCRGTFGDGSRLTWANVTLTDAGALAVGGNTVD